MEYKEDDYLKLSGIQHFKFCRRQWALIQLQLTAQAMCFEEMFSTEISEGAIFYGETRRRENVLFSQELRDEVKALFDEMHQYYSRGYTPKVKKSKSCNNCSLKEICLPKLEKTTSVTAYITQSLKEEVK